MFGFISPWTKLRQRREAKKAEILRLDNMERQLRIDRAKRLRDELEAKERANFNERLDRLSTTQAEIRLRESQRNQAEMLQRTGMPSRHLYQDPPANVIEREQTRLSMVERGNDDTVYAVQAAQSLIDSVSESSSRSCGSSFSFTDTSSSSSDSSSGSDCSSSSSSDSGSSSGSSD